MILRLTLCLFAFAAFLGCQKTKTVFSNNPDAPDYLHNRPVGASANEILSAAKYKSLKIEILYMPGYAPDPNALAHLQTMLNTYANKPNGITIETKQITASSSSTLNLDQIKSIEETNRTAFTNGDQLALYILYTNGNYTSNNVIGIAYRNTSIAIFGKTVHDNSGGLGQTSRTKLEATVNEHELGHLLGLVDVGSPMQTNHKDAAHGNHCNNSNCLMYYASETTDILGFLLTGSIPGFDANCIADLRANGGK
ncbi:MAG: hypothetical protein C4308_03435 [Chitinophagaceae bacterium]